MDDQGIPITHGSHSHHFSDIDTWKHPDRSYYTFITLSILLGFTGADHFYLRSFGTGFQKFIVNIFTFGMWYFWDLIQIFTDGPKVRKDGLDSPLEWIRGIGRGVFIDPAEKLKRMSNPDMPIIRSRKDIVVYAMLTVLFGIFGFDKLYMGHPWQGVAKFLSVFNILFFFVGLMWVIWDIVHVLFFPESILKVGITTPLPFNLFLSNISTEGQFIPQEISHQQYLDEMMTFKNEWSIAGIMKSKLFFWNWDGMKVSRLPQLSGLPKVPYPRLQEVPKMPDVEATTAPAPSAPAPAPAPSAPIIKLPEMPDLPKLPDLPKMPELPKLFDAPKPHIAQPHIAQSGGGSNSDTSGPIIAGTLSAIVLAGASKVIIELLSQRQDK